MVAIDAVSGFSASDCSHIKRCLITKSNGGTRALDQEGDTTAAPHVHQSEPPPAPTPNCCA